MLNEDASSTMKALYMGDLSLVHSSIFDMMLI